MSADASSSAPELRAALIEALGDQLRAQVLIAIAERPGAGLAQLAGRIGVAERRLRPEVEQLVEAGLVEVETSGASGRRYRAVAMPTILGDEEDWSEEENRRVALSVVRQIVADLGRAIRLPGFGGRDGHSVARVPGEVDEHGWHELATCMLEAMWRLEATMVASAGRLDAAGGPPIETISAAVLFEGPGWDGPEIERAGPRPSPWLARWLGDGRTGEQAAGPATSTDAATPGLEADAETLPRHLMTALLETLEDPLRAQVYASIAERPGATIAQVAARLEEPERRVRRQVERLLEAGLLVVWAETTRRNARARHYRAVAMPKIEETAAQTVRRRRRISRSLTGLVVADLARAVGSQAFGTREGHAEVRIPGEVDRRGWEELVMLMTETTERIEETMVASAGRLAAAGAVGIEATASLLLVETEPWERDAADADGPRPSVWLTRAREGVASRA